MEAAPVRTNPLTLRFPQPDEDEYQRSFARRNRRYAQFALMSAIFLFCLFGYLDFVLAPERYQMLWFIRYGCATPVLVGVLAFSFTRRFRLVMQPALAVAALFASLAVIVMNLVAYEQLAHAYFFGVIICNMYLHTFGRVNWQWSAPTSVANVALYDLSLLLVERHDYAVVVTANLFMISTLVLGLFAAYAIDRMSRRDYLRSLEMIRMYEELQRISRTDHLTGLPNRRSMVERLKEEGARAMRNRQPFVIGIIDADHFKNINDRWGHACGDRVLQLLAETMAGRIRGSDILARWGGEEFLVLFPETRLAGARLRAEDIRQAVATFGMLHDETRIGINVTIGLAEFAPGDSVEEVLRRADEAMYEGKRLGRNRTVAATPPDGNIPLFS